MESPSPRGLAKLAARRIITAAGIGVVLLACSVALLVRSRVLNQRAAADPVAVAPAPSSQHAPQPNPKVPANAALLMTFEKNTILDRSGEIVFVESLTGRCHGHAFGASYVAEGCVGGALLCEAGHELRILTAVVNDRPAYTMTAWIKRKGREHFWIYSETRDG